MAIDNLKKNNMLYTSEEELVNDVSRLMMLQDQDGLRMRVLKLYRNQDSVLTTAQGVSIKQMSLQKEADAKGVLINEQA